MIISFQLTLSFEGIKLQGNLEFMEIKDKYTPYTQFSKILLPISTQDGGQSSLSKYDQIRSVVILMVL